MSKISVTDEEERAYFKSHAQEFTSPATVTLREILVPIPTAANQPAGSVSVGLEEEAKAKAESVRKRAAAGEDFARLVGEFSEAPSKANAGVIGPISETELSDAIRDAIKGLKAGDLTEVLQTSRGFQVLRLDAKTDTSVLPFEKAREQIAERVAMQKQGAEFEKYLRKLRSQAIIEWKNDDLRKAYERHVAKPSKTL
jgi:parvulin-like peptidyl-prolyl isomerase